MPSGLLRSSCANLSTIRFSHSREMQLHEHVASGFHTTFVAGWPVRPSYPKMALMLQEIRSFLILINNLTISARHIQLCIQANDGVLLECQDNAIQFQIWPSRQIVGTPLKCHAKAWVFWWPPTSRLNVSVPFSSCPSVLLRATGLSWRARTCPCC